MTAAPRPLHNRRDPPPTVQTHNTLTHLDGSMGAMDEQTYGDRVRAIEDQLGVSTSDAQVLSALLGNH